MHARKVTVIFLLFLNIVFVFTDENDPDENYFDTPKENDTEHWSYYIEYSNSTNYTDDYYDTEDSDKDPGYNYDTHSGEDPDYSYDTGSGKGTHYSIDEIDNSPALRIVNGRRAKKNEIPYQISFKRKLNWQKFYSFCGGTLVSRTQIISAGHCFVKDKACDFCSKGKVSKSDLKHYWAVAGNLRTTDSKPSNLASHSTDKGQWKKLKAVRVPKTYRFPKDDIAVVTLVSPMKLNAAVKPIPFAKTPFPIEGKECTASGYGRLHVGRKETPNFLMVAKLRIWTKAECNRWHEKRMDKYICTSHSKSDVAEGDSGGPLVCDNAGKKYLVGVVCGRTTKKARTGTGRGRGRRWRLSYNRGHGGMHSQHSSYFTRVTAFRSFLAKDRFSLIAGTDEGHRTDAGTGVVWLCLFIYFVVVP